MHKRTSSTQVAKLWLHLCGAILCGATSAIDFRGSCSGSADQDGLFQNGLSTKWCDFSTKLVSNVSLQNYEAHASSACCLTDREVKNTENLWHSHVRVPVDQVLTSEMKLEWFSVGFNVFVHVVGFA